jgi:cation:H+ antiporter
MLYVAGFIVCAAIIFFAGKRLSYYGDLLAEKTGLSKGWIGLILMASVTSLPELMVGISSASIVKSADLATGDILGSCAFNLGILAMLDAFVPHRKPLTGMASITHSLTAGLGIILLALVGFSFFMQGKTPAIGWVGISTIVLIVAYFISIRIIYQNEKNHTGSTPGNGDLHPGISKQKIVLNYCLFAVIIILSALALPFFAEHIADMTGLGKSFVGTFFLAASTSLPEIAVSVAAVRMGSIDLSVGNLLGSNIFNILILAIDDIFYTKGILLQDASPVNMISVFSTIIMTGIVIIGFSYRARAKKFWLATDAITIFLVYFLNMVLLYRFIH